MGRKQIYKTNEERHEAQLEWQREHYKRNRERILQRARERYRKKKLERTEKELRKNLYGE